MKNTEQILRDAKLLSTFWGRRIMAASKRKKFTEKEKNDSANWTTCACGRVTIDIPRVSSIGAPCDMTLRIRGYDFFSHVSGSRVRQAALTLVAIEERARIVASQYTGK